jgi:hypothetical protein
VLCEKHSNIFHWIMSMALSLQKAFRIA